MTSGLLVLAAALSLTANAQDKRQKNAEMEKLQKVCAKNWPAVDENNDRKISIKEAENATKAQFKRIDVDGNGAISPQEWAACESPSIESDEVTSAKATTNSADGFAKLDSDESGKLSAKEVEKAAKETTSEGAEDERSALISSYNFAKLDTNGDGFVSSVEWNKRGEAAVSNRFGLADKNSDGKLSEDEFMSYRGERYSQAQQADERGEQPTIWIYYYYLL